MAAMVIVESTDKQEDYLPTYGQTLVLQYRVAQLRLARLKI